MRYVDARRRRDARECNAIKVRQPNGICFFLLSSLTCLHKIRDTSKSNNATIKFCKYSQPKLNNTVHQLTEIISAVDIIPVRRAQQNIVFITNAEAREEKTPYYIGSSARACGLLLHDPPSPN